MSGDAKPDTPTKIRVEGGTLEDFVELLMYVGRDWRNVDGPVRLSVEQPPWTGGSPYDGIVATFYGLEMFELGHFLWRGKIRGRRLPRGFLEISLEVKPELWHLVEPYWARIVEALVPDGWAVVETSEPPTSPSAAAQDDELLAEALRGMTRGGGPIPRTKEEKRRIIQGWFKARTQGMTQEAYCATAGVGSRQLREYMSELRAKGES